MKQIGSKITSGKNTRNIESKKRKSFGFQILGFGSGGGAAGVHRARDSDGFAPAGRANPCVWQGHHAYGGGVHGPGHAGGYYSVY